MEKSLSSSKKRIIVLLTLVIVVIVVLASYFIWLNYFRALSFDEVLNREHWKVGESKDVEGTITNVHRINTSYGPIVILNLQDELELCDLGDILGDVSSEYSVGDTFRTTLHFSEYWFNDGAGVWSPDIVCPMPTFPLTFGMVFDSYYLSTGIQLQFSGYNQSGWAIYSIQLNISTPASLDILNITLLKARPLTTLGPFDSAGSWMIEFAVEYVMVSGHFLGEDEIDYSDSLGNMSSKNGLISYQDMNNTGLLDAEDKILVKIDTTGVYWRYDTYFLMIEMEGSPHPFVFKYILNGPEGPYEWYW